MCRHYECCSTWLNCYQWVYCSTKGLRKQQTRYPCNELYYADCSLIDSGQSLEFGCSWNSWYCGSVIKVKLAGWPDYHINGYGTTWSLHDSLAHPVHRADAYITSENNSDQLITLIVYHIVLNFIVPSVSRTQEYVVV